MAIHITGDTMILKISDRVAIAWFSEHSTAEGDPQGEAGPDSTRCPVYGHRAHRHRRPRPRGTRPQAEPDSLRLTARHERPCGVIFRT